MKDMKNKEHHEHGDSHGHPENGHASHHEHMVKDFQRRFLVSLVLTLPIIWLSPMLRGLFGLDEPAVPRHMLILFIFSTGIFSMEAGPS